MYLHNLMDSVLLRTDSYVIRLDFKLASSLKSSSHIVKLCYTALNILR